MRLFRHSVLLVLIAVFSSAVNAQTLPPGVQKVTSVVATVTVDQVNAAFKKHIGPLAISIVKGGDFKKAGVYQ
jgi:hypothetical protein